MAEKKPRRRGEREPNDLAADLKAKREEFVQTFFKRGAEFTEELVGDNSRLRERVAALEEENTRLRTQLAKDRAVRELLDKIEQLEREQRRLVAEVHEAEETTSRFTNRFSEIETELESFANLYVASYQLHSTLRLPIVMRHLRELLLQLVGAAQLALFVLDDDKKNLIAIAADGVDRDKLTPIPVRGAASDGAASMIERVFLTGVPSIGANVSRASVASPAACIPMRVEEDVVGVIVIYSLLAQKPAFLRVDHELFKLLGAHAAVALIGAKLYDSAGGVRPSLESLAEVGT
jgi:GAF domain-containing protein